MAGPERGGPGGGEAPEASRKDRILLLLCRVWNKEEAEGEGQEQMQGPVRSYVLGLHQGPGVGGGRAQWEDLDSDRDPLTGGM